MDPGPWECWSVDCGPLGEGPGAPEEVYPMGQAGQANVRVPWGAEWSQRGRGARASLALPPGLLLQSTPEMRREGRNGWMSCFTGR